MIEVVLDGGFEFSDALEHATADAIAGDQAEEALDLVEPGAGGRREVHVEARMALEPRLDLGVLVSGVVVGDLRIPVKSAGHSDLKSATDSDLKPAIDSD